MENINFVQSQDYGEHDYATLFCPAVQTAGREGDVSLLKRDTKKTTTSNRYKGTTGCGGVSQWTLLDTICKELNLGMGLSGEEYAETFVCIQPAHWSTLGRGVQTTVSRDVY